MTVHPLLFAVVRDRDPSNLLLVRALLGQDARKPISEGFNCSPPLAGALLPTKELLLAKQVQSKISKGCTLLWDQYQQFFCR